MPDGTRRIAVWAIVAGAALAIAGAVAALALDGRRLVFLNGIAPDEEVATLKPQREVCQQGVGVAAPFAVVRLSTDTGGRPGPPLAVSLLDHHTGRTTARGEVRGGYRTLLDDARDGSVEAAVGRVRRRSSIDVCVQNLGSGDVVLGGTREGERGNHELRLRGRHGRVLPGNLTLAFLRARPRPLLADLPTAFERAALFHPPFMGAWTFWLLAALVAIGVPGLLARALSLATPDPEPPPR